MSMTDSRPILFVCGTHHQPFRRLWAAAHALGAAGHAVRVQGGPGYAASAEVDAASAAFVAPDQLARWAEEASVIVAHAGPASLFLAWDLGRRPVVVPRDPERGEHVDDHQLRFVAHLADRAVVCIDPDRLVTAWEEVRAATEAPLPVEAGPARTAAFVAGLRAEIAGLSPRRGGWRATLRGLLGWEAGR